MTIPPSPNPLPTTEGVTQGWQDIATAPIDLWCLMYFPDNPQRKWTGKVVCGANIGAGFFTNGTVPTAEGGITAYKPTHWMPLPPPPGQNT